jgi:GntR family transcriptional repressor for pyruvate dehydrogenase complex
MKNSETKTETLAEQLADRILDDIVAAGLKEGELFMTVQEIKERYGVSHTIAREALGKLSALGILKGKQRVGLLVDRPDPVDLMTRWLPFYARSPRAEDLKTLAQLRYVLELGSIDLAAANASQEQVQRLVHLAERYEKVIGEFGQNEEADRIELEYHSLLLSMTGNPLIEGMHRVLSDYFQVAVKSSPHWKEGLQDAVWEHRAIADAIGRQDAELARSVLRKHLENALI